MKLFRSLNICLLFCLLHGQLVAQMYSNWRAQTVESVKTYKFGNEINNPIIELGSGDFIRIEFDDLSVEPLSLDYTIFHCTPDWQKSDIQYDEFATGFDFNSISTYYSSQGTRVLYTHYSLNLPNADVSILLSGNYILQIVDSYNHDSILLQQRFVVLEQDLIINARVVQPFSPKLKSTSQQLNLEVNYSMLGSIDPFSQLFTTITQNNQHYNAKVNVKPIFQGSDMVRYSAPDSLVFGGGYEYRNLIYRSSTYQSAQIRNVSKFGGEYHLNLAPDLSNRQINYSEAGDINGKYIVKRDDCLDSSNEAEYLWFYFTLPTDEVPNVDVYLFGELSGWSILPEFKLNYSYASAAYEGRVLLKQGIYNYRYVTVDRFTGHIDHYQFEGNYFATENSYQIYVYFKPYGGRYWQLSGYKEISSRI